MLKIRIYNNNNCPRDSLGSDGVVGRKGACFLDPSCLRSRLHAFSRRSSRIWRKFRDLLKKREKNKKKNKRNLAIFPRTTIIVRDSFFFLCGKFWKKIFARDPRFRSRILRDNSRSRGTIDEELQKKKKEKELKKKRGKLKRQPMEKFIRFLEQRGRIDILRFDRSRISIFGGPKIVHCPGDR